MLYTHGYVYDVALMARKENRYSDRAASDAMNIKFVTFSLFAAVRFLKSVSFFHNLTSCWKRKVEVASSPGNTIFTQRTWSDMNVKYLKFRSFMNTVSVPSESFMDLMSVFLVICCSFLQRFCLRY